LLFSVFFLFGWLSFHMGGGGGIMSRSGRN
jgi:hypothetical protein